MILRAAIFYFGSIFFGGLSVLAQSRYQSLMWKVSADGIEKSSYLYGTMHISGKTVFHLGDQFYDAISTVDAVALELEPEAWLEAVFQDAQYRFQLTNVESEIQDGYYFTQDSPLPTLSGFYSLDLNLRKRISNGLIFDPAILNYLLFRYGDYAGQSEFEEDTWLDMYIYQVGKKMGKKSIGLETYAQSDYYLRQARIAEHEQDDRKEYDDEDMQELLEMQKLFEPAYRSQDLDLIDSLNKITTSAAFDKYILVERNKVFVHVIDSVLKSGTSIFAGMGCAHLPGDDGIIEMLRAKGYKVEPVNKGERSARKREKIDKMEFKQPWRNFTAKSGDLSFSVPAEVYHLGSTKNSSSWISLDMANGASFIVTRMLTYAGLTNRSQRDILSTIDSLLYESIPGDIVSVKRSDVNGNPVVEVMNVTRRGDVQRRMLVVTPGEIIILRLTATGDKVRNGYGAGFFSSFRIDSKDEKGHHHFNNDLISINIPGSFVDYREPENTDVSPDFEVYSASHDLRDVFLAQLHVIEDPEFLDEDLYELDRFAIAFAKDHHLSEKFRQSISHQGLPALDIGFISSSGKSAYTRLILQNLGYYAFTAFTSDSLAAKEYFSGVDFVRSGNKKFQVCQDTLSHFTLKLPYVYQQAAQESYYLFGPHDREKNIFRGTNEITYLRPPGSTESIRVTFQRFHRFSDGEDTLKFYMDKQSAFTRGNMHLESKNVFWDDHGCVMNFIVSDTATIRKYMHKVVLYNKSLYTLTASFDAVLGPGDFVSTAFSTFKPVDTVFAFHHFVNMDDQFFEALEDPDSTRKAHALDMTGEMDFSAASAPSIRRFLKNFPLLANEEDAEFLRAKVLRGLAADTSFENIDFIVGEFYQYPDSADYQLELLNVLLDMKVLPAWSAYCRLLIEEPPLTGEHNESDGLNVLSDSLEISAGFIPELLQLQALDEYEHDLFHLVSEALIAKAIDPVIYSAQLNQILIEARIELKKLNAMKESSYAFSTRSMIDYCELLFPYQKNPDVKNFFSKVRTTKKMSLLLDMISFDIRHEVNVHDSLINKLCQDPEQIIPLCQMLAEENQLLRLPTKFRDRETLLRLYLSEKYRTGIGTREVLIDTVVIVARKTTMIRQVPLDVYLCKFKKQRSKQWLGAVVAFDATNKDILWPRFIESSSTIVLDEDENEFEELDNALRLLIEENRRVISFGYGGKHMNLQWY